ncbi:MAG: hypothetical protein R2809_02390 [Flavobacteriales bacterium]
MKKLILFTLTSNYLFVCFQPSTFNAMHPMSIQHPPYNYTAHGSFFDAFGN